MKKLVALVLTAALLAGCTGSFALTKKVYNFHRSQDGKWMDELVFLGCVILPVYGLATLGDGIIFNSIEFWTGNNPIKEAKLSEGDLKVMLSYAASDDSVIVSSPGARFTMKRTDEGVVAQDTAGKVLFTSVKGTDGSVSVYNGRNQLVRKFSPSEIQAMNKKFAS